MLGGITLMKSPYPAALYTTTARQTDSRATAEASPATANAFLATSDTFPATLTGILPNHAIRIAMNGLKIVCETGVIAG